MASRDMVHDHTVVTSLAPAARTVGTANGTGVDLAGFEGALVVFTMGALTDGVHAPSVEESDTLGSGYTAVAAADLVAVVALVNMTANTVQAVAYRGAKRYIRAVIATTTGTVGALSAAQVFKGYPRHALS